MATLRRIGLAAVLIVLLVLGAVFAFRNPQPIALDLGFVRLERLPLAVALGGAFIAGWLVGLGVAAGKLWRCSAEQRRLRKNLRHAEAELSGLRPSVTQDAAD